MRISTAAAHARPWRIHEIAPDFTVEDVWALPAHGDAHEFPSLLEVMRTLDFPDSSSLPARALWEVRDLLGRWFGLGRVVVPSNASAPASAGEVGTPGPDGSSLVERLPDDLRHTADHLGPGAAPFSPLYLTDDEYAAEISNPTVHALMHLAWVDTGDGRHQGQMAVYVKPRGRFGQAYMAFIKPFRYAIVYPALMRAIEEAWNSRDAGIAQVGDVAMSSSGATARRSNTR
jgi:hypothetical protein